MAPRHAFLFDKPIRFVIATGIVAGGAWAATIGTAPELVRAGGHPYENPAGETEEGFTNRLARQGTSKVKRHCTADGIMCDANGKPLK
mmetsp:Transcript_36836/g.92067  ORF Transcript_36836/g.92067 Transcript_36836/m.92067 type:complete len:88 (-) Transcript_36836:378-641(-)|eukprot:6059284-Prymnesium_polylepis.2